jgi:predicted TPR repeat methyltransferase
MSHTQSRLDAVYHATTTDELSKAYDEWAQSYDTDMALVGYRHPSIGVALMSRYLPAGEGPVLDAGAGTGLVGEVLAVLGYHDLEALDASQGMLDVAGSKGVYRHLHHAFLGQSLPFEDAHFAAAISTGTFTAGHVGVEGLPELFRVVRPRGLVVLSVKVTVWDGGFGEEVERRAGEGTIELVEVTPAYASMPSGQETSPCVGVVMRVSPG